MFDDVDIAFNPNTEDLDLKADEHETSTRRKISVDLVWRNLAFTVPRKLSKAEKQLIQRELATTSTSTTSDNDQHNSNNSHNDPKSDDVPSTEKIILRGVNGYVRPGTMLAVMGSSGAGKT